MNKQKYEREQQRLTQDIKRLKTSLGTTDSENNTNEFVEHFKRCGNIDRLNRPLLTELVDRIVVSENGELDITFNFRDEFSEAVSITNEKSA